MQEQQLASQPSHVVRGFAVLIDSPSVARFEHAPTSLIHAPHGLRVEVGGRVSGWTYWKSCARWHEKHEPGDLPSCVRRTIDVASGGCPKPCRPHAHTHIIGHVLDFAEPTLAPATCGWEWYVGQTRQRAQLATCSTLADAIRVGSNVLEAGAHDIMGLIAATTRRARNYQRADGFAQLEPARAETVNSPAHRVSAHWDMLAGECDTQVLEGADAVAAFAQREADKSSASDALAWLNSL